MPHTPIFDMPPTDTLQFSVVIPVRDEAMILPRALAAFTAQVDLNGQRLDPARDEILVLANNCRDETPQAPVVPAWVAQMLWEIAAGADAVGGRIFVESHEDAGDVVITCGTSLQKYRAARM